MADYSYNRFVDLLHVVREKEASHKFGELPAIRKKFGKTKRNNKIFRFKPIKEEAHTESPYSFHIGGRTEIQFNIAVEGGPDGDVFRHGLAYSFREGKGLNDIKILEPSVKRFDKYLTSAGCVVGKASDFVSWYWDDHGPEDNREANRIVSPRPIEAAGLFREGVFIMAAGKRMPAKQAAEMPLDDLAEKILGDFDLLLDVYCYVEDFSNS